MWNSQPQPEPNGSAQPKPANDKTRMQLIMRIPLACRQIHWLLRGLETDPYHRTGAELQSTMALILRLRFPYHITEAVALSLIAVMTPATQFGYEFAQYVKVVESQQVPPPNEHNEQYATLYTCLKKAK